MTAAVLAGSGIYTTPSGFNPVLDNRIVISGPPYPFGLTIGADLRGVETHHAPTATSYASARTAHRALAFGPDDWYFRIHITPGLLALGNVVANENFIVGVWNAWLDRTQTLDSIGELNTAGLLLIGQPAPPLIFTRNQERLYTLEIGTVGDPTINAIYTFNFHDAESPVLLVTGSRITAWALTPDWQIPVREKLAWKTDVLRAWSGKEQRRALRISPRRHVGFSTPMVKLEKQYVENQLFEWGALAWALPMWWDGQRLTAQANPGDVTIPADTVNRDFRFGGLGMVLTDAGHYEVLQITSFTSSLLTLTRPVIATWRAGSRLYPVRAARLLATTRIVRSHGSYATVQPEFQITEPCDWPSASGLPMYRGSPVLEDSPDTDQTAEGGYDRDTYMIDPQTGAISVIDTALVGFPLSGHNWYLKGRTAHENFRRLLYLLKGQQGEIWVPSYEMDLTLVADAAPGDTNLHCATSGFTQFGGSLNRKDMRVELVNGTVYYKRIVGSAVDTPTTELIGIDTSFGVTVKAASVRRISFMVLSRLASDEITIEHVTRLDGIALSSTPFRGVNHDV